MVTAADTKTIQLSETKEFGERGREKLALESAPAPLRPKAILNQKLSPTLPLVAKEVADLLDLRAVSRAVRPGQEIVSEGKRCSAIFLLIEGIAIRYRILRDGQ